MVQNWQHNPNKKQSLQEIARDLRTSLDLQVQIGIIYVIFRETCWACKTFFFANACQFSRKLFFFICLASYYKFTRNASIHQIWPHFFWLLFSQKPSWLFPRYTCTVLRWPDMLIISSASLSHARPENRSKIWTSSQRRWRFEASTGFLPTPLTKPTWPSHQWWPASRTGKKTDLLKKTSKQNQTVLTR